MDTASTLAAAIGRAFRFHVLDEGIPRIRRCVELLDERQVWQRHGAHGNSIGNLLLHVEGNMRQWILCGIGGEADRRQRDLEFAARAGTLPPIELVERLATTAAAAVAIVEQLGADELVATRRFQGRYDRQVVAGVLHVLEHFSGHAYQIYAWTKALKDVDLRFFDL